MNVVEFAEEICDFTLTDFQKEFLNKTYESIKTNKRLFYIPPRGSSKFSLATLESLAIIFVANERGLLKNKED